MNKILAVAGILVAVLILVVSVVETAEETAYAVVVPDEQRGDLVGEQASSESAGFAWRGWLPGSPWHGVYVGVENVRVRLILSKLHKARVYLFYADERLSWTEELMEKGRYREAIITVAKGVNYVVMGAELLEAFELSEEWAVVEAKTYLFEGVLEQLQSQAVEGERDLLAQLHAQILTVRTRAQTELH